jgi:4-alpha-glucanotransferase
VLVALEDLWGERAPQNVPGTFDPARNFCRRMAHALDALDERPEVAALLRLLRDARAAGVDETTAPIG